MAPRSEALAAPILEFSSVSALAKNLKNANVSNPSVRQPSSDVRIPVTTGICFMEKSRSTAVESLLNCKRAEKIVLEPSSNNSWQQKTISIQTEPSLPDTNWISNDNGLLFEHIGTQTMENIYKEPMIETDSAFCQTDFSHLSTSDDDLQTFWNPHCHRNFANQPVTCDAQNQTLPDPNNPLSSLQEEFASSPISAPQFSTAHASNISSSIETQTEIPLNFNSAQTQTHQNTFNLHEQTSVDTDVSALDVLLNDIETQTELFLPTPVENTNIFVHSCTQTPDHDFLSEILNLET